ncbi:MAG: PKD domain-containing protein, partial [Alphaproteobacteria bacterium]
PRFKREPSNPNILIPFGLQSFVIVYLGLDPFLNTAGLFSIAQFRASVGLPPIDFQHPTAQTTGPYTAPPGRDVSFDGGPSEDPNGDPLTFAWDLDMDGLFDDANTELVDQPFAEPGTRLVGLRVSDPAGNSDVSYVQLKIGDTLVQDIIALQQYRPRNLRRVAPDGTATTIAENIMPGRPVALQLDTNGDVFALQRPRSLSTTSPFLFHFDPAGNLLDTLSLDQLIALIGRDVGDVIDIVMDGRGNLLLSANEHEPDPIFGFLGPLMVVRLDRGFTQASVLVDGLKRSGVSASSLAIDPEGKIVISDLGDPDGDTGFEGLAGVSVLDPEDGSVTQVVPATNVRFPGGDTQIVQQLFGGVNLNLLGSNAGGPRGDGGIAVDGVGNYIVGTGQAVLPLDLWRIPFPPEVTELGRFGFKSNVQVVLGLEIFPLLISAPGTLNLDFSDIGIDAGGDYLVVGRNTGVAPPFNHNGVWRISPASEVFLVADLGEVVLNQTGFVFDVTRDVREVTPRDIPAPPVVPELRLDTLEVDQAACPLSATVRATLTNTGAGAVEDPITVFFFDGDPLQDGAVIGTATAQTPIAPNAAVALSIEWPDPGPGVHQV